MTYDLDLNSVKMKPTCQILYQAGLGSTVTVRTHRQTHIHTQPETHAHTHTQTNTVGRLLYVDRSCKNILRFLFFNKNMFYVFFIFQCFLF